MISLQNHLRQLSGNNDINKKDHHLSLIFNSDGGLFLLMSTEYFDDVLSTFVSLITVVLLQVWIGITCTLWDREITVGCLEYTILNFLVCS